MTTSTTEDFSENMDKQYCNIIIQELALLIANRDFYLIKQKHIDSLLWYRNFQLETFDKIPDKIK